MQIRKEQKKKPEGKTNNYCFALHWTTFLLSLLRGGARVAFCAAHFYVAPIAIAACSCYLLQSVNEEVEEKHTRKGHRERRQVIQKCHASPFALLFLPFIHSSPHLSLCCFVLLCTLSLSHTQLHTHAQVRDTTPFLLSYCGSFLSLPFHFFLLNFLPHISSMLIFFSSSHSSAFYHTRLLSFYLSFDCTSLPASLPLLPSLPP